MKQGHLPLKNSILFILVFLAVSLFNHWEPGGESWGYWMFARIFSETGTFIIPDRSPVFVLYLNFFRWLGYPGALIAEYVVSTLIVTLGLVVLLRRYLSLGWLTFAVILWIPFLQMAEPPVIKLALACSCFAVALRENPTRFKISFSYALLILACMFRCTYVVCLGLFILLDLWTIYKSKIPVKALLPKRQDWPIVVVAALMLWFSLAQSQHHWNNPSVATDRWFASRSASLANQAFIGCYNSAYIAKTYGSFKDKDAYFTNKEAFGGATTMLGAIKANPKFVIKEMLTNIKRDFIIAAKFTFIPFSFYNNIPQGSRLWYLIHLFITLPIIGIILYGLFRACQTNDMRCFVLAHLIMIATLILALPKERYMHPMIPILILSCSWYVAQIRSVASKYGKAMVYGLIFLVIVLFSRGTLDWMRVVGNLSGDISQNTVRVMQARPASMIVMKPKIESLIQECRGTIALDHSFLAAFMNKPITQFYDIWEIPPFDSFGHSSYDGLRPERIDCILMKNEIQDSETNAKMRHDHYVKPYAQHLESLGAKTYELPSYGYLTVLKDKNN